MPIACDVRAPADFEELFKAGALSVEHWYAKGAVDFCIQVADGRMGYIGTVRDEIPHLLGRLGDDAADMGGGKQGDAARVRDGGGMISRMGGCPLQSAPPKSTKRSSRTGLSITIVGESASERNMDGKRS